MDTTDILTGLVAVYGALLSTIAIVRDIRRSNARIEVSAGVTWDRPADANESGFLLAGTVANHGNEPIHIAACNISLRSGVSFQPGDVVLTAPLPHMLAPKTAFSAYFNADQVFKLAVSHGGTWRDNVRIEVRDQLGRQFFSPFIQPTPPRKTESGWMMESPKPSVLRATINRLTRWRARSVSLN